MQALSVVQVLRAALSTAASASLSSALTLALLQGQGECRGLATQWGGAAFIAVTAALGCAAASEVLRRIERRFIFTDYVHGDK